MIKRIYITALLVITLISNTLADEGMWLPLLLGKQNINNMQELGFKLSADDIYSVNQNCLKDAIVLFGRGCTGELVSDQGLLITNHHCGYSQIQQHSSLDHDYLTDGFWAKTNAEELANPGLTVSFLIRMEDVTAQILQNIPVNASEDERSKIIAVNSANVEKEAAKETHYNASVRPFYYGNEYYLFVMETFKDIRLVGAPPSGIGKFGGDTDNWMWPRHTGDFSMFRIYANKDNKPAEYSKDNVPYKPRKSLTISLKGVEKNDFTMVYGFPARTSEYLPSYAVDLITNTKNPIQISARDLRLKTMAEYMKSDRGIRIQYSNKYASVANGWKKWIGENKGLKRLDAINKKQALESQFQKWAESGNEDRYTKYGKILGEFKKLYAEYQQYSLADTYFSECGFGMEIVKYALSYMNYVAICKTPASKPEEIQKAVEQLKTSAKSYFKDYYAPLDKEASTKLLKMLYEGLPKEMQPSEFEVINKKYKGSFEKYMDHLYAKSIFTDENKIIKFLNSNTQPSIKIIEKDPAYQLGMSFYGTYYKVVRDKVDAYESQIALLMRSYMAGLREMQSQKVFYPDANSTLRVSFGIVNDFKPYDGVRYDYYTTLDGIMEKEDSTVYDYVIPEKLKSLYQAKDYGIYGKDGEMRTCFIASNHTTGGNSGSPVLDKEGNLIGVNFDRNWEGTMSDIMYDPKQCRNIILDIRYCLFVIDKVCGARHLVDEMKIVKN